LISVETIYDGTLRVLDAEGADGLKARNLAARLHCSTRTLYEQVGNREALIRGLVAHAFARIEPDFHEGETRQESTFLTPRAPLQCGTAAASLKTKFESYI
jgi:AcrR family transcriptional regulator